LEKLLGLGYGAPVSLAGHMGRLAAVARAFDQGDIGLAGIALVQARLPPLPDPSSAERMAKADGVFKYSPDQPRVAAGSRDGGEWTSGGGGAARSNPSPPPGSKAPARPTPAQRANSGSGKGGASRITTRDLDNGVYDPSQPPSLIETSGSTYSQTLTWSAPFRQADPGQSGTAWQGAAAIQAYYASGKGGVYWVDPKTMEMENSIDIGAQIQKSINGGGFMRGILNQALKAGKPVQFDSSGWGKTGLLRFWDGILMPDGQTVGRFGGFIHATLTANANGTYSVVGTITPVKTGAYSFDEDAGDPLGDFAIREAGKIPDIHNNFVPNKVGKPMNIKFTRILYFYANGKFGPM